MKIDRSKGKKSSSEAPSEALDVIDTFKQCANHFDLLHYISEIKVWSFGKCELYHWVDVLDLFDRILKQATEKSCNDSWILNCDSPIHSELKECVFHILRFTTMLVEHSFSRHLYNSVEHLINLLTSTDLALVLEVLHLLYMFSKRSNYLTRMSTPLRQFLNERLTYLAESWGGKEAGFGLAACCQNLSLSSYPSSATSVHLEFTNFEIGDNECLINRASVSRGKLVDAPTILHLDNVHTLGKTAGQIMDELIQKYNVPVSKRLLLFIHLRLATNFPYWDTRLLCVQTRLQALSVLIYANGISDNIYQLLYRGFMEELVDVLELEDVRLTEIKASALRTLTSIIHLDRAQNFPKIIDVTEVGSYHGFLPMMVRSCITALTLTNEKCPSVEQFPLPLATALFSFVYHLASYELGGEALVNCGMLESLIKVINWNTIDPEQITFVTRAVRVIDLITNMDMQSFQTHNGLTNFINRLEMEVAECRKEQPYEILVCPDESTMNRQTSTYVDNEGNQSSENNAETAAIDTPMETDSTSERNEESAAGSSTFPINKYALPADDFESIGLICMPQRAALLKSMLNFLKKAIQDQAFSDSIRHIMETSLPHSLKHIISNAEFYGSSLFLLATDVVTVYVFQEPSLLSALQDSGITDVILDAILIKELPPTREVITSMPNVFSALSLNTRGLNAFVKRKPFHHIFRVLINPDYLPPMRRRRTAEPLGDTASNLGNSMDELMRHQPSLKVDAIAALIELLQELCNMGRDTRYSCWKAQNKQAVSSDDIGDNRTGTSEGGSSDDDDDDEEENLVLAPIDPPNLRNNRSGENRGDIRAENRADDATPSNSEVSVVPEEKTAIPLVDYIFNVMKFADAILSNNSTDDHCREFVTQKGLQPLMEVLAIPNLPLDFPNSPACQAASSVCKSIINLSHEGKVLKEGMSCLEKLLSRLEPLNNPIEDPGSSVLLRELSLAGIPTEYVGNPHDTPILNAMTATHAYIMMFIHVCRTGQSDIRAMSITHWGSREGLRILKKLSKLYWNLVWESTVLLALCSGEYEPGLKEFARSDLDNIFPAETKKEAEVSLKEAKEGANNNTVPSATFETNELMEVDNDPAGIEANSRSVCDGAHSSKSKPESKGSKLYLPTYAKLLRPILSSSSRLGRALAELFGLLVKLCVGSPLRQRRGHHNLPTIPGFISPGACAVARVLSELLTDGLNWEPLLTSPVPKLTFKICAVGFSAPLLFDEKKFPFHLMLKKFLDTSGMSGLFSVFYWALNEGIDDGVPMGLQLSQKQIEFMEAWLVLIEKFVNPKTILETPHILPAKAPGAQKAMVHFEPNRFLAHVHKLAFEAVLYLWTHKSMSSLGAKGAESMLGILCHILRHKHENKLLQSDENQPPARADTHSQTSTSVPVLVSVAVAASQTPVPVENVFGTSESSQQMNMATEPEPQNIGTVTTATNINTENTDVGIAEPASSSTIIEQNSAPSNTIGTTPTTEPDDDDEDDPDMPALEPIVPEHGRRRSARLGLDVNNGNSTGTATAGPSQGGEAGLGASTAQALGVDFTQLQQLTDMGFGVERCIEALISTSNLMQATDYLLNNGNNLSVRLNQNVAAAGAAPANQAGLTMDWDYNDEEQILRAIVMSLGDQSPKISNLTPTSKGPGQSNDLMQTLDCLKSEDIDVLTETILAKCISMVDDLPETVFKICEVLVAVGNRRGKEWVKESLTLLVQEIATGLEVVSNLVKEVYESRNSFEDFCNHPSSYSLYIRLHLFGLMFEEAQTECATLLEQANVINPAIMLVSLLHRFMLDTAAAKQEKEIKTPRWLAPLVLLFDLYEKSAVASKRRAALEKETDHLWKWFDINSGKWCAYSTPNNQIIDNAFWLGESSVRISAGRRRYVINFNGMVQLNEETSNRRPITLWLKNSPGDNREKTTPTNVFAPLNNFSNPGLSEKVNGTSNEMTNNIQTAESSLSIADGTNAEVNEQSSSIKKDLPTKDLGSDNMDIEYTEPEESKGQNKILQGLSREQINNLIISAVGFFRYVLPETLHALMRLCLRITRDFASANVFSRFGGVQILLTLTEESAFTGFLPLANLLIRHSMEDPSCLRFAMEKMIRAKAMSSGASTCKELHYLLRILAPVACRSPSVFAEVAKEILRVDVNFVTRRGLSVEDDLRLIIKPIPCKSENFKTMMGDSAKKVIHSLLLALPSHLPFDDEDAGNGLSTYAEMPCPVRRTRSGIPTRRIILDDDVDDEEAEQMDTDAPTKGDKEIDEPEQEQNPRKKYIIPKFAIFQLLAESVHSYSYSSKVIAEYTYQGGKFANIPEDTNAIAYLLDSSLSSHMYIGMKDCMKVVQDLISAMAGCNHLPEVQTIIVSEVKAALQRAVNLRESYDKHGRITALSNLLAQMIETCPSSPSSQMLALAAAKPAQLSMNPILKLALKKGLMVDLTRIPHHLDLTSEELCGTMNSLLSTLEVISRIVNQPIPVNPNRPKPKSETNAQDSLLTQDTSNSAATRAQGEETVEDADNTEHDISAEAESLDPTSESHTQVLPRGGFDPRGAFEEALSNMRNHLVSGDNPDDLIGEPQNTRMDTEQDEANDSSDSDSEPSVEGEEDGEDEDDDEEDDDDDDDEVGSGFDENEADFMEEGFIRFPGLEREEEMLMVQYGGEQDNAPVFFTNNTSYNFNLGLFEDPLVSEHSSGLRFNHPLLSSPANELPESRGPVSRQRSARQRRYQYFQYINPRHPHPPAILQRLLGPSTAQEVMQLTTGQGLPSSLRDTRFVVQMNDPPLEISSVNMRDVRDGPRADALANYTALHWWCEESKALDGESMHDCVVAIKREIVQAVEADRDEIFKSRQEKRSKDAEEGKKKETNDTGSARRTMPELALAALAVNQDDSRVPLDDDEEDDDDDSESDLGDLPSLIEASSQEIENSQVLRAARNLVQEETSDNIMNLNPVDQNAFDLSHGGMQVAVDSDSNNSGEPRGEAESDGSCADVPEVVQAENKLTNETPSEPGEAVQNSVAPSEANDMSSAQPTEPVPGPSGLQNDDFRNILGDIEVPEGVDPSFLAALPEEMRQEVLAEHLRQQRLRQRSVTQVPEAAPTLAVDVSPEFLAALPANIQEELLTQQRLEQQRRVAVTSNPNDPVDTEAFFRNLQPSLRQSILADMEDSQIAVLPPALAAEAQTLRREWETRNRQLLQDRFIHHNQSATSATLSSILRNSGLVAGMRHMSSRYALHNAVHRGATTAGGSGGSGWRNLSTINSAGSSTNNQVAVPGGGIRVKGKQLVDHETLCCILIILYVEDPKINNGRLHRVLRNLSYHAGTRNWIIRALLSVLEKGNECTIPLPSPVPVLEPSTDPIASSSGCTSTSSLAASNDAEKKSSPSQSQLQTVNPSWLNVTLESAMGCRANVFHIQKSTVSGKKGGSEHRHISIHPQAVPSMCKNTMDMLCNLAKSFPCHFLPGKLKATVEWTNDSAKIMNTDHESKARLPSTSSGKGKGQSDSQDGFFELLLKLDSATSGKKGKCLAKASSSFSQDQPIGPTSFEESHFGKLISMLGFPFIRRSSLLTDKLLRILAMISLGIPDTSGYGRKVVMVEVESADCIKVPESHLRLIVEVITSKSCSEDGLEEATSLLLNLSYGPPTTRDKILKLLTEGVRKLGIVVCEHIASLRSELQSMNKDLKAETKEASDELISTGAEFESIEKRTRGTVMDRFTKESVIITSKSKGKPSSELQLPTMLALTSKSSSQAFFLRLLKVIINLREAIRVAIKKHKKDVTAIGGPIMSSTAINGAAAETSSGATGSGTGRVDQPMDVDQDNMDISESPPAAPTNTEVSDNPNITETRSKLKGSNQEQTKSVDKRFELPRLSAILELETLWETLSECLLELGHTPDHHAVLVLQPAVEAFFLVHASSIDKEDKKVTVRESREAQLAHLHQDLPPVSPIAANDTNTSVDDMVNDSQLAGAGPSQSSDNLNSDARNFVKFAETHSTVLNQILRQSTSHLADGPFAVLVDHTRVLDFDVKRRYFRTELERLDEGVRREDLAVHVRRSHVFEDSFRELQRRTAEDWKNRFYIVFEGEEGQDAGGLLREWYMIISREIFNPMYALFTISPGDRVTYMINPSSHCNSNHLFYFKFVGRVIAKAIYDNKLLECYFTRSFYKHILGKYVKHIDMESEDYSFYQGLAFLIDNHISELGYDLTFSTEVQEFGVTEVRDLILNGRNSAVTEENKMEYIRLVCQMKMTGAIRKQLNAFLEGFYDIIPKRLISIFSEQELELLVSGLPNIDIEDLKANTEYHKYQPTSLQIQWFWRALRSFDQADRAKFLQFVTGTSKVPLQGFAALEGMNGVQKFQIHRDDRSTDRLPSAHTCFNQLDLPAYETYDKLRCYMLKAVHECSEGFGFA